MDWSSADEELFAFTRKLIKLRRKHPVLRRMRFFTGRKVPGTAIKDISWITPEGKEMAHQDWNAPYARSLAFLIAGEAGQGDVTAKLGSTFLVIMNAYHEAITYTLPSCPAGSSWELVMDTSRPSSFIPRGERHLGSSKHEVGARSFSVLLRKAEPSIRHLVAHVIEEPEGTGTEEE
jgi:glycogen operon protein